MRLADFLQNIALGELSGSSMVDINSFEILAANLPKVIQSINQGLEYFYSNFVLKQNNITIQLRDGISHYYLDDIYALSNESSTYTKYILDTHDKPFTNDVIKILAVNGMNGYEFTLNDPYSISSIFTPEYNCIHVPNSLNEKYLSVRYQAAHPKIPLTEPLTSNVRINLPSSFNTALQTYVASLIYQNMGGNNVQIANNLFAKFKTLTEELKLTGIGILPQVGNNIKPMLRNWL